MASITEILSTDYVGDSRTVINDNFEAINDELPTGKTSGNVLIGGGAGPATHSNDLNWNDSTKVLEIGGAVSASKRIKAGVVDIGPGGSSKTIDLSQGNIFYLTLSGGLDNSCSISLSNIKAGQVAAVRIQQTTNASLTVISWSGVTWARTPDSAWPLIDDRYFLLFCVSDTVVIGFELGDYLRRAQDNLAGEAMAVYLELNGNPTTPLGAVPKQYLESVLAAHAALTATHGVAGAIVGTTDTQKLTNKNIVTTHNAQTGTSYTPVLTDAFKLVTLDNASAITLTVPPNSSVAYDVGTTITLLQKGAGQVTVAPGSGVTVSSRGSATKIAGQYGMAVLHKIATDTWVLSGDITT